MMESPYEDVSNWHLLLGKAKKSATQHNRHDTSDCSVGMGGTLENLSEHGTILYLGVLMYLSEM
jgi:hypothetical protein